MEKFVDVFERWEQRQLSQVEAAEILGKSERQFRRYIDRYEAAGLEGLRDGRLGQPSGKAIPKDAVERILALFRKPTLASRMNRFERMSSATAA